MKNLTLVQENYLEAIFDAMHSGHPARSKDIAARLGVNPATVTSALRSLCDLGMIVYEPYGPITLTAEGNWYASRMSRRHEILANFFSRFLCVDQDLANEAACRAEHALNDDVMERLNDLMTALSSCPRIGQDNTISACCCKYKPMERGE